MNSMNIKKGDKVKVLAGKDKGKELSLIHILSGFWSISWCFYVHAARVSIDPILQTSFPSWVFEILSSGRAGCRFARWRIRERLAVARKGGTLKEARRKRQRVFRMPTRRVFCA